jgi:hypothetical protein
MIRRRTLIGLIALVAGGVVTDRVDADTDRVRAWQMSRLYHPTQADRHSERKGKVMIYSGLKDKEVEMAMDENFDRIENMMFTRTVITDVVGEPRRDAGTDAILVEDDGCD